MTSFPPEIVETFLSYSIDLDDELTLRQRRKYLSAYCLVSRTWCAFAQPRLFAEIVITPKSPDSQASLDVTELLSKTLSEFPHTQSYVKTLTFIISSYESDEDDPAIKTIEALRNVKTFRIMQPPYHSEDLGSDLIKALPGALSSEHLTSLGLCEIVDMPVEILGHPLALEELTIKNCSWDIVDPDQWSTSDPDLESSTTKVAAVTQTSTQSGSGGRRRRPSPSVFILSNSNNTEANILAVLLREDGPLDLSNIKQFWAMDRSNGESSYRLVCRFASTVSPTLEDILVDPPTTCVDSTKLTELFPAETLSNLKIARFSLLQSVSSGDNAVPWAMRALSHLPHPEKLESIFLHCELRGTSTRSVETLLDHGWSQLDASLLSHRFTRLDMLHLSFYQEEEEEERARVVGNLKEVLPGAEAQGILTIECCAELSYVKHIEPSWLHSL